MAASEISAKDDREPERLDQIDEDEYDAEEDDYYDEEDVPDENNS